jgi:L-ascorbate metabolism protein UlaG (beta-lactamase superfamily)
MGSPLRHLGELAQAPLKQRTSARADREMLGEVEARPLSLPPGLEVEWLGVSGYRLTYEGHTLFVDPYISRVPPRDLLLRRRALPDQAALDRFVRAPGKTVGVLVGHTHFDHAVDAPALARHLDCDAYGSASLVNLMALHGMAERAVEVEPYRVYEMGPFEVSFTPSAHSKLLLGLAVPYDGELTCEHLDSLSPAAYRCGQVWGISIAVAGVRFYHQGSANLIDDAVRERGVDVFLAGVAGRGFTERYWQRILPLLEPRIVVPTHYDNFFRPLGQELEFVTAAELARLPEEIGAVSGEIELAALPRADLDEGAAHGPARPPGRTSS